MLPSSTHSFCSGFRIKRFTLISFNRFCGHTVKLSVSSYQKRWQLSRHLFWCKLTHTFLLNQLKANFSPVINVKTVFPVINVIIFWTGHSFVNRWKVTPKSASSKLYVKFNIFLQCRYLMNILSDKFLSLFVPLKELRWILVCVSFVLGMLKCRWSFCSGQKIRIWDCTLYVSI